MGPDKGRVDRLRHLLAPDDRGLRQVINVPGCFDAFSALLIEQAGFDAAFVTGSGVSMTRLGRPDIGLVSLNDLASLVATIRERVSIPLIVDADTGFGNALNVGRCVRLLERAGADVIQLEDQVFPKKCGHMAGKAVISAQEAAGKIRAAVDARDHALISARTDALAIEGIEGAIRRASMYLDAGCDLLFIEGPRTMAEIQAISSHFAHRIPLVHNLVEGGITPVTTADALVPLNFAVALHPLTLLIAYANAATPALEKLGGKKRKLTPSIETLQDLNRLVDHE